MASLPTMVFFVTRLDELKGFILIETPMNLVLQPWHLMVMFLASWINRQQQKAIECLRTENQVLKEKLGKKRLIMDGDTKFWASFRSSLSKERVQPVRLPPRSPNMNAHLERFFGSLKSECLDRLILFGEGSM